MESTLQRIQRAEEEKDWAGVCDILEEAKPKDVEQLEPLTKHFLANRHWIVRASAVEMVGVLRLHQFAREVKLRLSDPNSDVRSYALMAYYDLLGARALPVIKEFAGVKDTRLRVTALVLLYVQTQDKETLARLGRLLTRKRCRYDNRYVALNEFDYYLDLKKHPEVVSLLERILQSTPRSYGLAKDIRRVLRGERLNREAGGKRWKRGTDPI